MFEVDLNKEVGPATLGEKITYFLLLATVLVGFVVEVFINYEPIKLTIVLFAIAWIPLVFIHELGHALMARLVGWEVEEFVIGYGKILKKIEMFGMKVEFRMLPLGGYVLPRCSDENWSRIRSALVYFAGPGIELIIFVLLYFLIGVGSFTESSDDYLQILMQGVALSAVTGAVVNLIPHEVATLNGNVPNDGLGVILSLFGRRD